MSVVIKNVLLSTSRHCSGIFISFYIISYQVTFQLEIAFKLTDSDIALSWEYYEKRIYIVVLKITLYVLLI